MTPTEYQAFALSTYCTPDSVSMIDYVEHLLVEELGEVFSLLAKSMRDGHRVDRERLVKELGDVLWCVAVHQKAHGEALRRRDDWPQAPYYSAHARIWEVASALIHNPDLINMCCLMGYCSRQTGYALTIEEIASVNVAKLKSRQARGVLHGEGDDR